MKKTINCLAAMIIFIHGLAQEDRPDSLRTLDEVTVRAFEQNRPLHFSTSAVKFIETNNADRYNKTSLVQGFNTVAGVRMEERSPGSYRINIRGSSLRSPFGVRNVKIYWNEIPVTDPGGNTYFNQFAYNNFSSIEISKGPASSLYGAGTGGVLLISNFDTWRPGISFEYNAGSYGTHTVLASGRFGKKTQEYQNKNQVTYAHNESNSYRRQSSLRRDNISWISNLHISGKQQLTASLLYTDMYYQTPGALTLAEFNDDPRASRPAGGPFPSAENAKAAIFQKNLFAGLSSLFQINPSFSNTTGLYGAFAQVRNPAIRNYERRNEPHFGGRTVFKWKEKTGGNGDSEMQLLAGAEYQQGYFNTLVSGNRNGNPDTIQTNDDINNRLYNIFLQADLAFSSQWFITAGASYNKYDVSITRLSEYPVIKQSRGYKGEFTPRLAFMRKFKNDLGLRFIVSKGFSPPTTAEVLPSTGVISTDLEAEKGWNYETVISYDLFKNKLRLELTGFYFRLDDALVQRRDLSGADYFTNAGDVKQKGIEFFADYTLIKYSGVIDYMITRAAYTYSHFRYGSFIKGAEDFSGKTVPSVPEHTLSLLGDIYLKNGFYTNATFYMASGIFLNDANTAKANAYEVLGWRLGWAKTFQKNYKVNIYAGVDNLLDEVYSLGNDINAPAGRYYNAAPGRNYYTGVSFQWMNH